MVGQLGDFQWLNILPTPDLATFPNINDNPKNIDM